MSTTGHYPFNDIYAKIIFMQQGNERTFEQIKSIWRFLNCDIVIHKEVELNKIFRAGLTLNVKQLFQMINEVEIFNTIDEIEVKDIYIVNDLIKSIENLPNQKDWRGITANGYKEPKNPKYNSIKESVINEFKTYLLEQKEIIEQPQQEKIKDNSILDLEKESDYNDMFVVSKEKCSFYDNETKQVTSTYKNQRDSFDLKNYDIYFMDNGELFKRGSQLNYNSCFIIKLDLMYTMKVHDFLNYQYENSKNPKDLLKYVKYCTTDIKGEGKKQLIKDWVSEIENSRIKPQKQKNKSILKDFFFSLDENTINDIKNTFKNDSDTDLAMLVDILNERNLIEIINNSKTKSRKHFVVALTDNQNKKMQHINKLLSNGFKDVRGIIHNERYKVIEAKLDKILNKVV